MAIFNTEEKAAAMLDRMDIGSDDYRVIAYGSRFVIAYFEDGAFVGYV
jgi:hypothetical protein